MSFNILLQVFSHSHPWEAIFSMKQISQRKSYRWSLFEAMWDKSRIFCWYHLGICWFYRLTQKMRISRRHVPLQPQDVKKNSQRTVKRFNDFGSHFHFLWAGLDPVAATEMDRSLTTFHNVPWMSLELLQETEVDAGEIWVWPDRTDVKMMVENWCEMLTTRMFFLGKFKWVKVLLLRCWGPVRRSCAPQSTHHTPVSLAGFCSCSFGSRPATCRLWFRKCGTCSPCSYVHVSFDRMSSDIKHQIWYIDKDTYIKYP